MGFTATDTGGGNFKRVPSGVHIGRCYSLIDLGTQLTSGQFGEKMQHKIRIGWELFGEDEQGAPLVVDVDGKEMPMVISKSYTVSLHEKANLRKELAQWRGRDFTEEEAKGFDISKLVGAYCMVNVTTSETNGKTYSNVAGLTPIPSALKNSKPSGVHAELKFDLDHPDVKVFEGFHQQLQDTIKKSPEWAALHRNQDHGKTRESATTGSGFENMDDDIPF
jgi:hypothetical protein